MLALLLCAALGYFLGSIPFGLILTRQAGLGDIRSIGSGNIGATNVLRTGNKKLAALTLLLDAGKGALAVLIAVRFSPEAEAVAAVTAVLGHLFPVWLRFKGGKGVATAAGVLLAYSWPIGLAALATWIVVALTTRYSSVAALTAAILTPVYVSFATGGTGEIAIAAFVALLVVLRHHGNIRRLWLGEEGRIRLRRSRAD